MEVQGGRQSLYNIHIQLLRLRIQVYLLVESVVISFVVHERIATCVFMIQRGLRKLVLAITRLQLALELCPIVLLLSISNKSASRSKMACLQSLER